MAKKLPKQVLEIAERLRAGQAVRRHTVRSILKWFGAARRGRNVVPDIKTALAGLGLGTNPELDKAGIDALLQFSLCPADPVGKANSPDTPHTVSGAVELTSRPEVDTGSAEAPTAAFDGENAASDDQLEPDDGDEGPVLTKPDERPVTSQSNDWNISTLREKMERGFLVLQPSYQREYVWRLKPELRPR